MNPFFGGREGHYGLGLHLEGFDEEPAAPATGFVRLYTMADGVYCKLDDGTVVGPFVDTVGGGGYTNENAQDAIGGILIATATITPTYDDATPDISFDVNNDSITFAKMQNIATDRLLGRDTAATGDPEEISLDATLEFTGSASIRRAALTGDVTAAAGSNATAIGADKVLDTMLRNSAAVSVIGRSANSGGDPADIAAGANDRILRRVADALDFGQLTVGMAPDDVWTYAKIQNVSATDRLLGRFTAGAGDIEEIVCTAAGRALLDDAAASDQRTTLGLGALAVLNTVGTGQIDDEAVTLAKLAHAPAWTFLARNAGSTGDPSYVALADLAAEASPAAGDFLLAMLADGSLVKIDWDDLPAGGGTHNLLDGTVHPDTVAQSPTRGSLVYANSTPKWDELPLGTAGRFVKSDGSDVRYTSGHPALVAKYWESLTKTNIGSSYVDIYTTGTAFHQTRLDRVDFADVTEVRLIFQWDYVGAGTQQVRIVDRDNNTNVLVESAGFTADQDPGDTGWVAKGAAFTSIHNLEFQGKSTTAGDDPIAKGYALYVR